jgi:hypothetical protein
MRTLVSAWPPGLVDKMKSTAAFLDICVLRFLSMMMRLPLVAVVSFLTKALGAKGEPSSSGESKLFHLRKSFIQYD